MNVQIEKNGRKFLVSVVGVGCEMLEIAAYEIVRPNWKIFRIKFFPFVSKTEFISCPSCGRTMFDLQQTLKAVKSATSHLKGLKIGVMGCIVNGPGEMADADYGYVGAGVGRISLYRRKECIERNLPQEEAIEHLINLIKANGEWQEPTK